MNVEAAVDGNSRKLLDVRHFIVLCFFFVASCETNYFPRFLRWLSRSSTADSSSGWSRPSRRATS